MVQRSEKHGFLSSGDLRRMSPPAHAFALLEAIQQVVGPSRPTQPIALHEPDFRGTEAWTYVKDCLDSGW